MYADAFARILLVLVRDTQDEADLILFIYLHIVLNPRFSFLDTLILLYILTNIAYLIIWNGEGTTVLIVYSPSVPK